jgi:hypothetical protein
MRAVWISQLASWFAGFLPDPEYVYRHPDYQLAFDYKNNFQPKASEDYGWVRDYADFVYGQFEKTGQTLDAKAESIMKLLGGGSGLLTLTAIVNLTKIGTAVFVMLGIALAFAIVSILIAAWVRLPGNYYLPPSVAWALEYVAAYSDESCDRFIAQWHLACEGARISLVRKGRGVWMATASGAISIFCVGLSFFVAWGTM